MNNSKHVIIIIVNGPDDHEIYENDVNYDEFITALEPWQNEGGSEVGLSYDETIATVSDMLDEIEVNV